MSPDGAIAKVLTDYQLRANLQLVETNQDKNGYAHREITQSHATLLKRDSRDCISVCIQNGNSRPTTFIGIATERERQEKKWGEQNHDPLYWLGILGEEYGEVCKAVIENHPLEARGELTHLAAVAVAFIESLERNNI